MSQHDFDIANQGFAAFRADLNNALKALGSLSSGDAEPATTYANQLWYETDTNILHIRNEANSAWLDLMVIDPATGSPSFTAGNVGIGTASPSAKLDVIGTSGSIVAELQVGANDDVALNFRNAAGTQVGYITSHVDSITLDGDFTKFSTGGTERARISSTGSFLVGKTSADSGATAGVQLEQDGLARFTRTSTAAVFNRLSTEGTIVSVRKDGTTVGDIGVTSARVYIASDNGTTGSGILFGSGGPVATDRTGALDDNAYDVGSLNVRWDDIYATNGTIQTSDRNEKQDIEELSEAERRVAVACKGLLRKYRWKDAVAEKGDDARIHFGIIAQDLQAAFAAEGLDAGRYAMFISSTWWEMDEVVPATETEPERTEKKIYENAEEAPEGATERTRLGVRYPELLAFIIAVL
jgi:hypothetical protein